MRKLTTLSVLLSASLWLSCSKTKTPDKVATVYHIDQEIKSYFDFHEGSYWIYRDTVNNITDSFAVTDYRRESNQPTGNDPWIQSEIITINIDEHDSQTTYPNGNRWVVVLLGDAATFIYSRHDGSVTSFDVQHITQTFSLQARSGCDDMIYTQDSLVKNYILQGQNYGDVYAIYIGHKANSCTNIPQNDWLYISKEYGFVSLLLDNFSRRHLLLQRAHIVR